MRQSMMLLPVPIATLARCAVLVLALGSIAFAAADGPAGSGFGAAPSNPPSPRLQGDESGTARDQGHAEFDLPDLSAVRRQIDTLLRQGVAWYRHTPPGERMCWVGLLASAVLALAVVLDRLSRLRRKRIVPAEFTARFLDRLHEGKLDGGKALDYCEMNPSPAARIALAAVRRWGRPAVDLERAVTLAHRVEAERLRRNVGTLRRIAALTPLLGLLGTLLAAGRVLAAIPSGSSAEWGPGLASALLPLTLGVALATLVLVAYDALVIRIERLAGALDRLGAETIDAIAMAAPPAPRSLPTAPASSRIVEPHAGHPTGAGSPVPSPHQVRSVGRRVNEGGRQSSARDQDLGF
jgi:biopolymer transport protein ExbB